MANALMIAAVATGGAIGAVLRYTTSLVVGAGIFGMAGPLATLLVNIAGSAMMGGLAGLIAAGLVLPETWRGFFAVGLLGALTTFSSFALDAGTLWQKQGALIAGAYVMASVILSLLAFGAAFWAIKHSGIWQ
jgi:CrcB protein